jgi:site-specific recombinase XerD
LIFEKIGNNFMDKKPSSNPLTQKLEDLPDGTYTFPDLNLSVEKRGDLILVHDAFHDSPMNPSMLPRYSWNRYQLRDVLDSFLKVQHAKGNADKTVTYYRDELKSFIAWLDDQDKNEFLKIDSNVIYDHLESLEKTRNKGGIHARFRAIRAFFNFFVAEYDPIHYDNPMDKVTYKTPNKKPLEGISFENVKKLMDACENGRAEKRDRAIIACLVSSGLRAQELLSLNIGDIDEYSGEIRIKHGKGDKERVTFFDSESTRYLRKYLRTRKNLSDSSPLFTVQKREKRLTYYGLREIIRRRSENAGIETPGLHDFRRAFALKAFRDGMDILTLSTILGHSDISTTRRYLNINTEDLQNEYRKIRFVD